MRFKLGSWPYPVDMPAHLYWVKSPMQAGKYKHWQQKLLFLGQNGHFHEHILPWGVLPSLKLGGVYVNGEPSSMKPSGLVKEFKLGENATCSVHSVDILRNEWLDKVRGYQRELLWERCACIEDGDIRLWVPCFEIARSFFAINKQMAYLLLEPSGLTKICSSELDSGRVRVDFNMEVPVATLNELLVTRIVTISHHPAWWNCWQQVWNRSIKNPGEPTVYSRLFCSPPIVKDSIWKVRGIESENGFFVQEVRGFRTAAKLPFYEVIYTHPKITYSEPIELTGAKSGQRNGKPHDGGNTEGEIDSSTMAPKGRATPYHGKVEVAKIQFGNSIKVLKLHAGGKPKPSRPRPSECPEREAKSRLKGAVPVSMNDEAGVGEIRAAEFKPIEMLTQIPPGLKPFIAAIKEITWAIVGCTIEAVPDESPLAKLRGGQRFFALVHIIGRRKGEGYVLEIDSSDGHSVSTLIFISPPENDSLDTAKMLLVKCLAKAGHWSLEALKRDILDGYDLAKHASLEPFHWGCRLHTKVVFLGLKSLTARLPARY